MTGEPIIIPASLLPPEPPRGRTISWFAGCGLQSLIIRDVFGRDPDSALNHNASALGVHQHNFPETDHYIADVDEVDPMSVHVGDDIDFGWFSPDCTHHSRASGKALKSERRRGLGWAVVKWARLRKPKVMLVENVPEYRSWGPLYPAGHGRAGEPDPAHAGETFAEWVQALWDAGATAVEWRVIICADYGDPTTRERLFILIRFDGRPIVWPARTHAPRHQAAALGLKPWVGAYECIDFTIDCPSILMTKAEAKAAGLKIKRPLVAATNRRCARGIDKFVISTADPFIVSITHKGGMRARSAADPLATVTCANRGELALCAPVLTKFRKGSKGGDLRAPMPAAAANSYIKRPGGAPPLGIMEAELKSAPILVGTAHGESWARPGLRAWPVTGPLNAVKASSDTAVAAVYLEQANSHDVGGAAGDPLRAGTGKLKQGVVAAYLGRQFGSTVSGRDMHDPHPAVMTEGGGGKSQVVAAHLESYYRTGEGSDAADPVRSTTGRMRHALNVAWLAQANTGMTGRDLREPISTVVLKGCTQQLVEARLELEGGDTGRRGRVLEFLWEHFGPPTLAEWDDPLATHDGRLKFGLVVLDGQTWMIVDIGLRMLQPKELLAAMGAAGGLDLSVDCYGRPVTKTEQIHQIGNGVCRHTGVAIVSANDPRLPAPDVEILQEAA